MSFSTDENFRYFFLGYKKSEDSESLALGFILPISRYAYSSFSLSCVNLNGPSNELRDNLLIGKPSTDEVSICSLSSLIYSIFCYNFNKTPFLLFVNPIFRVSDSCFIKILEYFCKIFFFTSNYVKFFLLRLSACYICFWFININDISLLISGY